ncbi:hypothetical protein MMC14_009141 [Varicellaria rhodocarpa]|nr:hypothetical protein [Varicellaria rhodocarpa]
MSFVAVEAARPRLHSRPSAVRQESVLAIDATHVDNVGHLEHGGSLGITQDPVGVQQDFCRVNEPVTAEDANMIKVPIDFHNLSFSMFCYHQRDAVSEEILQAGSWETQTSTWLLEAMEHARSKLSIAKEEAVFLDIGANIGWRSICSNSDLQPRLTFYTEMLSNGQHDNCTLISADTNLGDGIVTCDANPVLPENYCVRDSAVKMTTLDIVLADLTAPILLVKMDVEGHEGHVFQGAIQTIFQAQIPYLMFEFSYEWVKDSGGQPDKLLQSLVEAGYHFSFESFHGTPFDPLIHYADPEMQQDKARLANLFCAHESMLFK